MSQPRVLFVGSKRMGLRCLEALVAAAPASLAGVVTLDDRGEPREVHDGFVAVTAAAGLPLHVVRDRKHFEELIAAIAPTMCVVVGWFWIVGREALAAVPGGYYAVHNSLLPRYRGGAPIVWAMMNGEREVGVSLFRLTDGMDDGDVYAQRATSVDEHEAIGDVLPRLEAAAVAMLAESYPGLLAGTLPAVPQDHRLATFAALRIEEDGAIDWNRPVRAVHDFVRAQSRPYPGAFTLLDGERLHVWRARPLDAVYYGTPGQVASRGPEGVAVICGDHRALLLEEVQLGEREGPAAELVRSLKTRFPR